MLLYLLISIGACACFVEGTAPPYLNSLMLADRAKRYLEQNILPMVKMDKMPLLDDPRRHAAVLWHVMFQDALNGRPLKQRMNYMDLVTGYAPEAYSEPEMVMLELETFIGLYENMTNDIVHLVNSKCMPGMSNAETCDDIVQKSIKGNKKLTEQGKLLLTTGKAANAFLEMLQQLTTAAKNFVPIQYLIKEVDAVSSVTGPLTEVVTLMFPRGHHHH